ncbi:MAG: hypothetical protein ACXVFL_10045 [Solirubrobacteraceae bacterium]
MAAAVLLAPGGTDGRTYALTGPESLTLAEAAGLLSRLGGRAVRFEDETDAEAFASRAGLGAPDWQVRAWVSTYQAIRDGSMAAVSSGVRDLTGRDPASLEQHLRGGA